jgi:arsenate reductase (thioredoxin)
METKAKVLILCTGNSCRSQLAEALVNHDLGDRWQAFSAGTHPTGSVHPLALKVLEEVGIEHHGVSKPVDQFLGEKFDLVITVCDEAAENCPVWLGKGRKVHIGFEDPAKAVGTEEEQLKVFRMTRDAIREQIIGFLREL